MCPIYVYTSITFYEFTDIGKAKHDEALHTLQAFEKKNHMALSLFIAETINCQFFTIRNISMHFGYGAKSTQSVYIFYIPFINKMQRVC